jgi:hypothetical protein
VALTKVSPSLFQVSNNITSTTVGGSANTISLTFDSNGVITGASNNALSVANTQLTGLIQAAQIGSANATLITSGTLPGARLPTGTVLQMVNSSTQTQVSSTSGSTWVDTGLTASITPTSSTSTILVLISQNGLRKQAVSNSGTAVALQLLRGASVIANIGNDNASTDTTSNGGYNTTAASTCYLDSPATTSSTTYKVQFNNARNTSDSISTQYNGARSTITLLEIAA